MKRKETKSEELKFKPDTTNEIVVMAAVVLDEKARKKYITLPPDYFFGPDHEEMWIALQELFRRGLDYSMEAVRTIAGEKFKAEELDKYVKIYEEKPPTNVKHHVDMLRWDKKRNDAMRGVVPLFLDAIRNNATDPGRIKSLAKQISDCFTGGGDLQYLRDMESVVKEHSSELKARREGRAVYRYGIDALDFYTEDHPDWEVKKGDPRMVPGTAPGTTSTIVGVSGMGKSTVTVSLVLKMAAAKRRIVLAAWEPTSGRMMETMAAVSLGWSLSDLRAGRYSEEEQELLEQEALKLKQNIQFMELPFDNKRSEKFERLNDKNMEVIDQYIAESGCDVFVADVFAYALAERRPDDESRAIKMVNAIGKKRRCHMMLLHHMNLKELEKRADKRPTRDAVMGTSGWVNDVDDLIAIHWPGMFGGNLNKIEFHLLKQRYGRWGHAVECDYDPIYGEIKNGKTIIFNGDDASEASEFLDFTPPSQNKNSKKGGYRKQNR